jgi:hypothetical protein
VDNADLGDRNALLRVENDDLRQAIDAMNVEISEARDLLAEVLKGKDK